MRAILAFAALLVTALSAASLPPEATGRPAAGRAACPHLGELLTVVQSNGHRLTARRLAGNDIARLFVHLGVELPPRIARADTAVVVHGRLGRGKAVVVLFTGGCVLAAMRLPAADAVRALARLTAEEA